VDWVAEALAALVTCVLEEAEVDLLVDELDDGDDDDDDDEEDKSDRLGMVFFVVPVREIHHLSDPPH
jgi:hypothetical protein